MLNFKNSDHQQLLTELSSEAAANINGGQNGGDSGGSAGGSSGGNEQEGKFNSDRYLQALGISYLSPPGIGEITDKEALLAQYQGWED